MSHEQRYILIVAVLTLAAAALIGVTIALATGDLWRGARAAGMVIAGSIFSTFVLWAVGMASGNH